MTIETSTTSKMGESPIFTTKAHVFHIDPQTKRSWIPASSSAVHVNFYFDQARGIYRIISVEGNKAVINSTITPNMTFTKTSQKFGQWSDIRANTVYGLGFSSEPELNKFIEKFQEVKEATRASSAASGGSAGSSGTTKANGSVPNSLRADSRFSNHHNMADDILMTGSLLPHQRSQSLSGLQAKHLTESPKYSTKDKQISSITLPQSSAEAQLRYENDRLKLALAQSSTNAKKWEIELQTLKSNNTRLTNALQESTANVEEWKRQLQTLKDENTKMKHKIIELEAIQGNPEAIAELRKEIHHLRSQSEVFETDVREKNIEIDTLKKRIEELYVTSGDEKIKMIVNENDSLRGQVGILGETNRSLLDQLNNRFGATLQELRSIQAEFASVLNSS